MRKLRWKGEDTDDGEEDADQAGNEKLPGKKTEKKKKKKASPQKKKKKKKAPTPKKKPKKASQTKPQSDAATAGCIYKAGDYSTERKEFIAGLKATGMKHKEASKQWDVSERRAELLCNMPRSEQVRRRFVAPAKPRAQRTLQE